MSSQPLSHLGDISIDHFLDKYWQKKPLLVRNAIANAGSILEADELAGLSLEEELPSRLILKTESGWQLEHGPLQENRFSSLPESDWSLLVQNVDAANINVNELLKSFRFLPNWRLDDVMVSFASDRGGVGPHFDYYDVFLIQGQGQRRWKIGQHCNKNSPLIDGQDMKILQAFDTQQEFVLNTGDMLYIPAQIAHWGESIGDSMCYSIGFRAPSHNDFIFDYSMQLCESLNEDQRYRDGQEITHYSHTGEILPETIQNFRATLIKLADNPAEIARWLGQYSTDLKPGIRADFLPIEFATQSDFQEGKPLVLSHFNRCTFIKNQIHEMDADDCQCFINGVVYITSLHFAQTLSSFSPFTKKDLNEEDQNIASKLINEHKIVVADSQ
jgi:50S ribosomal protein L16 3-hydroxylase